MLVTDVYVWLQMCSYTRKSPWALTCTFHTTHHSFFVAGDSITRRCVSDPDKALVFSNFWGPDTGLKSAVLGVSGTTVEELTVSARSIQFPCCSVVWLAPCTPPGPYQCATKHGD